jgi:HD-GYP domain-containing protein (c-di-GMP phosphodiesterase class II)
MQLLMIAPTSTEMEVDRQSVPLFTVDAPRYYQRTIAGHALRTSKLVWTLAHWMLCSEDEANLMALAALGHDMGKISIPATILDKPGPLTKQEWAIIRRHPQIGYQMLCETGGIYAFIAPLVLAHHERWDGNGYPYGLAGKAIPLGARVLAVVDAFDAMTEQRPYRPTMTIDEAKAELLRCADSAFDPEVVEALLTFLALGNECDQLEKYKCGVIGKHSLPIYQEEK